MAWSALPTDTRRYIGIAALLTIAYAIVAAALYAGRDFDDRGPLSYHAPGAGPTPAGIITAEGALEECFFIPTTEHRVIAGQVRGRWYYACYETRSDTGSISVKVLDEQAAPVTDVAILKEAGVWPWVGVITTDEELVIGFMVMAAMPLFGWRYYRKARPGPAPRFGRRWWQHPLHPSVAWGLAFLPSALALLWLITWPPVSLPVVVVLLLLLLAWTLVFFPIVFLLLPGISRARKIRIVMQVMLTLTGIFVAGMLIAAVSVKDPWGIPVIGMLMAGFLLCPLGGWRWLAHSDFDYPDRPPAPRPRRLPWPTALMPQAASLSSQPAPLIPTPSPSSPPPVDVAIREFRAWAKFRNITSRTIRGVTITLAVLLILPLLIFFPAESLVTETTETTETTYSIADLFIFDSFFIFGLVIYGFFFIVPGVVAALLSLPLILGWRDPARVLVLRPFNRADHSRSLRGLVRREVAGYGHVYTLADTAIKIRWYVTIPVVLGQLGFLSFRLRQIRGPRELEQLAHVLIKVRRRNLNWAIARSKLFAARCTDTVWQQAVTHVARTCDAVLIDITDLTKGLAWELGLLQGLGRLDDCIFLALHGFEASAQAMLTQQLGRTMRLFVFDQAGRLVAPREFRNALAAIIFRTTGRSADLITGPDPAGGPGDQ